MNISNKNKSVIEHWLQYFNNQDLESILKLYHENCVHYSPKLKLKDPSSSGYIKGKEMLRSWWGDSFLRLPTLKYTKLKLLADGQFVFLEYLRTVEGQEDQVIGELFEIQKLKIKTSRVFHS